MANTHAIKRLFVTKTEKHPRICPSKKSAVPACRSSPKYFNLAKTEFLTTFIVYYQIITTVYNQTDPNYKKNHHSTYGLAVTFSTPLKQLTSYLNKYWINTKKHFHGNPAITDRLSLQTVWGHGCQTETLVRLVYKRPIQ